jgi:hypothetical protein
MMHTKVRSIIAIATAATASLFLFTSTTFAGQLSSRSYNPTKAALQKSQLKELNFQDAKITDVLDFLVDQSREMDPKGEGMNLIYLPAKKPQQVTAQAAKIDPILAGIFDIDVTDAAPAPEFDPETRITMRLRRVSMFDALKYITEMAGLSFRIDKNVIIVRPAGQGGEIETRFYAIDPSLMAKQMAAVQQAKRMNEKDPFDF